MNTLSRVDVGEIVGLEIQLPSGKWLQLSGEVTSFHNAVGFGLQFSGLVEDDESALNEVVGR